MAFDAEKEISKLWRNLHSAQGEIGRTWYRWRQAALDMAGPGANSLEVSLKAAAVSLSQLVPALLKIQTLGFIIKSFDRLRYLFGIIRHNK